MGKREYSKVKGFLNSSRKVEIHAIPKTWDEWISILRIGNHKHSNADEKPQTFQSYGFLTYFTWSRNPYNSQTVGWVNSYITKQAWKNTGNSLVPLCLTDSALPFRFKLMQSPLSGTLRIPITRKYSVESHIIHSHIRLWVFEEIWKYFFSVHGK